MLYDCVCISDIQGSDSGVLKCVFTQGGKEVTADQDINVLGELTLR